MTETIIDQAIAWHRAQDDADFDWDGFTLWLEADPAHRAAFDEIALLDAQVARHRSTLATLLPPVEMPPVEATVEQSRAGTRRRGWAVWGGGGMAAALVLAMGVPAWFSSSDPVADYRTGPKQVRAIALKDGSRIWLAGGSHLRVEGEGQDRLALDGKAMFDIPHRPGRTMTIRAGGQEISDIGTRFDILADAATLRVAVAEGTVAVRAADAGGAVHLSAGRQLIVDRTSRQGEISAVARGTIGSWQQGRLVYEAVPLSLVASDISRYAAMPVRAAPDVADRRFSGVLIVGDGSGLAGEVAQLMDLRATRENGAILLRSGGG
jgi:transmembrane sensor